MLLYCDQMLRNEKTCTSQEVCKNYAKIFPNFRNSVMLERNHIFKSMYFCVFGMIEKKYYNFFCTFKVYF